MAPSRDTSRFFGRKNLVGAGITAAIAVSFFIPTPYYIYMPGSAEELASKVSVENGQKDEKGNLMLTTVLSMPASNIYYLAYGYLAPHAEFRKEEEVKGDFSDLEYDRLLKHMMTTSQQAAIINAYRAAGEPYEIEYQGIFVNGFTKDSRAKGKLEAGDVILEADGKPMKKAEDFLEYLKSSKKAGDKVKIVYTRDEQRGEMELDVMEVESTTNGNAEKRLGIGFFPENTIALHTPRKVDIHADDIGGPSAGLMFSLEIYSQLTPGDLTKGYRIAGTGQIDLNGNVKQIGGIRHKIVAAENEEADIFFAPADVAPNDANTKEAQDEAAQRGSKFKVVPVKTMQDAIDYLKQLPEKQS